MPDAPQALESGDEDPDVGGAGAADLPEVLDAELRACYGCVASAEDGLIGHAELEEILTVAYGFGWSEEMDKLWAELVARSPRQRGPPRSPLNSMSERIDFAEFVQLLLPFCNDVAQPAVLELYFAHHGRPEGGVAAEEMPALLTKMFAGSVVDSQGESVDALVAQLFPEPESGPDARLDFEAFQQQVYRCVISLLHVAP
jgi:hypothetical protein